MRAVSIENVKPGMQVGRTIHGANGEVLLAAGVKLSQKYIDRLNELGIVALYIYNETVGNIEIDDVVSEKTRLEAMKVTKEVMSDIKINPAINVSKVNSVVNNIIDDLLTNKNMAVNLVDIRAMNDYTFGHSVNVAILSLITGIAMGYDQIKLRNLAAGALFHDIGKIMVSEEIVNKRKSFTEEEIEQVEQHPILGFDILRKIDGFSLLSAHVALQHHEKYDGTGFPRKIQGEEISEFARIVAVADFYDKLTTEINRERCTPFQAIEIIVADRGKSYDPKVVEKFIHSIAIFPVGTIVLLNTGEKGVIVKTHKLFPTRPKVRVLFDQEGDKIDPPYEIDLTQSSTYCISRVLEEVS